MGSKLYAANGFEKLDTWVVQLRGEEEKLVYDVMKRKRKGGLKEWAKQNQFQGLKDNNYDFKRATHMWKLS